MNIKAPHFPFDIERGTYELLLTNKIYIERDDFRLEDSRDYYALEPNKEVKLKYVFNIKCTSYILTTSGQVESINAEIDFENKKKCKGKINWVAEKKILSIELRHYNQLFLSDNKTCKEKYDDWIKDLNPQSLEKVIAYTDSSISSGKIDDHYQFEKLGYYIIDQDTRPEKLIFNRTVKLIKKFKS